MEHFSEQEWADRARGFSTAPHAQKIDTHLAVGCLDCKAASDLWNRVRTIAITESNYAPPENLVRLAKLEFVAKQEAKPEESSLLGLIFDSISQPLPAGVRSSGATARQVVYEGEGFTVDLRFDRVAPSRTVALVGQILDKTLSRGPLNGALIVIWAENGQPVATTVANEFGEFQLDFEPQDGLWLTARVGPRRIRIPLESVQENTVNPPYERNLD